MNTNKSSEYYRNMLGSAYRDQLSGTRYRERTGLKYLPPMPLVLLTEIVRSDTQDRCRHSAVVAMWLIILDSRRRYKQTDIKVSGKLRYMLGLNNAQYNRALGKLEQLDLVKVRRHKNKCHRIRLTKKSMDMMKDVPPMVHERNKSVTNSDGTVDE